MTSANPCNPFIRRRLMKMQRKAEYIGTAEYWGIKKRDIKIPFYQARKQIIKDLLPETDDKTWNLLAAKTRGLDQKDIRKEIEQFSKTGTISYVINHPTNTCDPYTGNWTEHLIDIGSLQNQLKYLNLQTKVISGTYSFTNNKVLNLVKLILNFFIRNTGKSGLYLSGTYILKVKF
jgi:hypothetical protein